MPHCRYLGRRTKSTARLPGGEPEPIYKCRHPYRIQTTLSQCRSCGDCIYRFGRKMRDSGPLVLGIGQGRTGTHSLWLALRLLGMTAVQLDILGQHVLDDWRSGGLTVPDGIDAVIGPYVAESFKDFDSHYPGSRFILTTRDRAAWLHSVRKWMGSGRPGRDTSSAREFMERRIAFMGSDRFDERQLLAVWDHHHAAVREHFRDRPGDLLEIDFSANSERRNWELLCEFLSVPVPRGRFPRVNASPAKRGR